MPCKKAKKSGGKKKKPCLCRAEDSDINAELFGGGIYGRAVRVFKKQKIIKCAAAEAEFAQKVFIPGIESADFFGKLLI